VADTAFEYATAVGSIKGDSPRDRMALPGRRQRIHVFHWDKAIKGTMPARTGADIERSNTGKKNRSRAGLALKRHRK